MAVSSQGARTWDNHGRKWYFAKVEFEGEVCRPWQLADVHDPWLMGRLPGLLFFCLQPEECGQCKHSRKPTERSLLSYPQENLTLVVAGISVEARHPSGLMATKQADELAEHEPRSYSSGGQRREASDTHQGPF